jgi:hypothetical protein
VSLEVSVYLQASLSASTKRAYLSDLAAFVSWGGQVPSTTAIIADYLVTNASVLSSVTLR